MVCSYLSIKRVGPVRVHPTDAPAGMRPLVLIITDTDSFKLLIDFRVSEGYIFLCVAPANPLMIP
jgi:hypothetical protein